MNLYLIVRYPDHDVPRQYDSYGPFESIEQLDAVARRWRHSTAVECYIQYGAQGARSFYSHRDALERQK